MTMHVGRSDGDDLFRDGLSIQPLSKLNFKNDYELPDISRYIIDKKSTDDGDAFRYLNVFDDMYSRKVVVVPVPEVVPPITIEELASLTGNRDEKAAEPVDNDDAFFKIKPDYLQIRRYASPSPATLIMDATVPEGQRPTVSLPNKLGFEPNTILGFLNGQEAVVNAGRSAVYLASSTQASVLQEQMQALAASRQPAVE